MTMADGIKGVDTFAGIDLQHLSKRLGDNVMLDGVSLRVEPGHVTALIGSSGADESTLPRCINLLEFLDSRSIHVAHDTIEPGKESRPRRSGRAAANCPNGVSVLRSSPTHVRT